MKNFFFAFFLGTGLLAHANALPMNWSEFEINQNYKLQNNLELRSGLTLPKGSEAKLMQEYALSPVQVMFFQWQLSKCPSVLSNQKTEIVIIQNAYGVELEPHCLLNTYVELKDYYHTSFFSK